MARPAAILSRAGAHPDVLTITGFVVGMAGAGLAAKDLSLAALACLVGNRIMDGLDGAVARVRGTTDRGAFLDISLDFFFYAAFPFGFAIQNSSANAMPAAALLLGFIGSGTSFLAFAALARKRYLTDAAYPNKGITYIGGLTEGFEAFLFLAAICIWPAMFPVLAWMFAALCLLTTLTRWRYGFLVFGGPAGTNPSDALTARPT